MSMSTTTLSLPQRRARPARPGRAARVELPLDVRLMNGVTSRLSRTMTMPVLFWPRMWLPVMPV